MPQPVLPPRKQRALQVLQRLDARIERAETELHYRSPFELLVAVVLSAQCTDARVNKTTPALFARFPDPQALAAASVDDIFALIRSISYPNNKAKHLKGLAQKLVDEHGGQVPLSRPELEALPGVGRKTANVLLAVLQGAPVVPVDTHVMRVSRRLGLAKGKTPLQIEAQLMQVVPPEWRANGHHLFILHGRYTCTARSPQCNVCPLSDICVYHRRRLRAGTYAPPPALFP